MTNFVTPVGRLVQGSLSQGSTKSFKGEDLVWKSGQNQGQPRTEYYVGLAVPKTDAEGINAMFAVMQAAAAAGYPGGESALPTFAWKFIDGDTADAKGKPYSEREGHAGCYIFRLSTSYNVKCSQPDAAGNQVVIPAETIKKGFYIRIAGSVTAGDKVNPSLFLNMNMCELVGYGEEIISGPDANTVFGATAAALPAGASATPMAAPGGAFEAAAVPVAAVPVAAVPVAAVPVATLQAAPVPIVAAPVAAPVVAAPAAPNPGFVAVPGVPG